MVVPHDGKAHVGQNLVGRRHAVSGPIPQLTVEIAPPRSTGPVAGSTAAAALPALQPLHVGANTCWGAETLIQGPVSQLTIEIIPHVHRVPSARMAATW